MQSKILVGIPLLMGYKHCMEAINSVIHKENVDVLLIDNGAADDIKELIKEYEPLTNCIVIRNPVNIYVNASWNQMMFYFINNPQYDLLVIMNSDLTMQNNWAEVLRKHYSQFPLGSYLPIVVSDCVKLERMKEVDVNIQSGTIVTEGTAGIFITLSREQCELVYDIPETLKVWYGDNWIYGMLRGLGHETVIPDNLFAFHGLSQTVSKVEGIDDIIAKDRYEWNNNVEPYLNKLIESKRLSQQS